jgi:hypothetical protein
MQHCQCLLLLLAPLYHRCVNQRQDQLHQQHPQQQQQQQRPRMVVLQAVCPPGVCQHHLLLLTQQHRLAVVCASQRTASQVSCFWDLALALPARMHCCWGFAHVCISSAVLPPNVKWCKAHPRAYDLILFHLSPSPLLPLPNPPTVPPPAPYPPPPRP